MLAVVLVTMMVRKTNGLFGTVATMRATVNNVATTSERIGHSGKS